MPRKLTPAGTHGLGRFGTPSREESIRYGAGAPGLERARVSLSQTAFEPHRHDAYALGITTGGVQVFRYRGALRTCLPGQLHLLHPDELHDGASGVADSGFTYRIAYVATELVREAVVPARPLPFVADPVHQPRGAALPLAAALRRLLGDFEAPMDQLLAVEAAVALADGLAHLSRHPPGPVVKADLRAVRLVRDYLAAHPAAQTTAATLEHLAGTDRYTMVRHFKAAYGVTPDRYRMQRRLDIARAAIVAGRPLAQAAAEAGFADQSHLNRQFKRAYGITPGRWQRLTIR